MKDMMREDRQTEPELHDLLSTVKTWKEDRPYKHIKDRTPANHSHIWRKNKHTEEERDRQDYNKQVIQAERQEEAETSGG